jgi:hypothetical protein
MQQSRHVEVTVVIPFGDHEEVVGAACRRVAAHLRALGLEFEILAVDEDCGDNSHAVLALLRGEIPELRVSRASVRGRGFAAGANQARGRVLWLIEPRAALSPLAPFGRAYWRVSRGEALVGVVGGRFAVCHRTSVLAASILDVRGAGVTFFRRLLRAARAAGLEVDSASTGAATTPARGHRDLERPSGRHLDAQSRGPRGRGGSWLRLLRVFSPARRVA